MKRVYLAGPIKKGDLLHNILQAEEAFIALMNAGIAPFVPHWSCYMGSAYRNPTRPPGGSEVRAIANPGAGNFTHEQWVNMDLAWVEVADAVLRLPGESVGADREVEHAKLHNVPVFYAVADVLKWAQQEESKIAA